MSGLMQYIKGSFYEFRHNVEFPTWKDLSSSTMVVAVATIILAIFLFAVDRLFGQAMSGLYTMLRNLIN